MAAASDSRFLDAVGFARFLDVVDAEWMAERLPQEDVAASASAAAALAAAVAGGEAALMDGFGGMRGSSSNDDDQGGEFAAGLGGLTAAERERKELQWVDPGTDLLLMQSASAVGARPVASASSGGGAGGGGAGGGGGALGEFTEEEGILAAAAAAAGAGGKGGAGGAGGVFGGEDVLFQLLEERRKAAKGRKAPGEDAFGYGAADRPDDDFPELRWSDVEEG